MRIAIVGSGISGLVAAYHLRHEHDITVFEANDYIGGHTHTVEVALDDERHAVDTGFIVFNDRTYPNFCRLLDELGVSSVPTSMSFSVRCDRTGVAYNGTSLNGLFAQRANFIRPRFYRMIHDILRFNRESTRLLERDDEALTVGRYLAENRYSKQFADHYLLPMGSAIWSCPTLTFEQFPMRFIVEFYRNHGLLGLSDRPTWRVIRGGSQRYVEAMTRVFRNSIRLNTPVASVIRHADSVTIVPCFHAAESFDEVIFACHSDQALKILGDDATATERSLLRAFPYEANIAVLHTDTSLLPRQRRAWASWNYRIPAQTTNRATVTYNMNELQHIRSKHVFCVTLNDADAIDSDKVVAQFRYSHPVFTAQRLGAQRRHHELIRANRTSFCGAYWGHGFHEDGVNSALAVCSAFERASQAVEQGVPVHA